MWRMTRGSGREKKRIAMTVKTESEGVAGVIRRITNGRGDDVDCGLFFLCVCEVKKKRTKRECGQTGSKAAAEVMAVSLSLSLSLSFSLSLSSPTAPRTPLFRTHYIIHDSPSLSLAPAPSYLFSHT